jgi:hypothetical protein
MRIYNLQHWTVLSFLYSMWWAICTSCSALHVTSIYIIFLLGLMVDVKEVICGDPECAPIDTMITLGKRNWDHTLLLAPYTLPWLAAVCHVYLWSALLAEVTCKHHHRTARMCVYPSKCSVTDYRSGRSLTITAMEIESCTDTETDTVADSRYTPE